MRKAQLLFALLLFSQMGFAQNCPPSTDASIHVVQSGETLYRIAKKNKISVAELTALNGMKPTDVLSVCKQLVIKKSDSLQSKGNDDYVKNDYSKNYGQYVKQEGKYHKVQPGESIANLARLYGYTTERF